MHYYALAVIPAEGDVDELIAETMAPYDESREVEQRADGDETYWHNPHGLWDWYQRGGRYTGRLDGYDPDADPNLLEECFLCHGTGLRDDDLGRKARAENPDYTCNGCAGEGKCISWPSRWPEHAGDIVDLSDVAIVDWVSALSDEQLPYAILAHGAEAPTLREKWDGEHFRAVHDKHGMRMMLLTTLEARARAGLTNRIVIVDYHD